MEAASTQARQEQFALDPRSAGLLARAERRLGEIALLSRIWPLWPGFAQGPLTARAAVLEAQFLGRKADLTALLALGPKPQPSRPNKDLRWAAGLLLTLRRLEEIPADSPLTPSLVTELFHNLDAPALARSLPAKRTRSLEGNAAPIPGAAAWTLAPRWVEAGLPPLMAAGLALAAWEREGPDHPHRGPAGRVFLMGAAPRLGLPAQGLAGLGLGLAQAAAEQAGGLEAVLAEVRRGGSWRRWLGVFLQGVEISAAQTAEVAVKALDLVREHMSLIGAWVRAPRHPLRLLELLVSRPVVELPEVAEALEVTQRTAGLLATKLKELGLLAEVTGQRRGRRFAYEGLVEALAPSLDNESP